MFELSINADVDITIDDSTHVTITAHGGQTVDINFETLSDLIGIWRRHGSILSPILERAGLEFDIAKVTVRILVAGTQLARIGSDVPNTVVGQLIGLKRFDLSIKGLLQSLFR